MSKENLTIPLALVKDIIAKLDDEQLKELEGGDNAAPASCTGGILSCFTGATPEEA